MKINTKFNIGDKVIYSTDKPRLYEIWSIQVRIGYIDKTDKIKTGILYDLDPLDEMEHYQRVLEPDLIEATKENFDNEIKKYIEQLRSEWK